MQRCMHVLVHWYQIRNIFYFTLFLYSYISNLAHFYLVFGIVLNIYRLLT